MDAQADTEQTHPVDDNMCGGSTTHASVTACRHGYTEHPGMQSWETGLTLHLFTA